MVDLILGIVGTLLYPLFSVIFLFIDLVQGVFQGLAGIGPAVYDDHTGAGQTNITAGNTGGTEDTGLVFYFLNTPLVKNLLMSILILAIFLLIVFTVMAFIKNAYTAKPKTWQEIVGNALKGLLSFVAVPVFCLLGIWVSNIILIAINGATSTGGSVKMSRKLFIASAYNANSFRIGSFTGDDGMPTDSGYERARFVVNLANMESKITIEGDETVDELAEIVDQCYAEGDVWLNQQVSVSWGYQVFSINYLIMIVGGIFMLYVLVTIAYAMVRRILFVLMLFVISPAVCAMYPIDDGAAVGQWRKKFISTTIGAYGAVAGLNIFFSLLPLLEGIQLASALGGFHGAVSGFFVDGILQVFLIVCGLFVVKEMMSTISGFIGGDDAFTQGSSLRNSTKGAIKKHVGGTVGVFTKAAAYKKEKGSFIGGLFSQAKDASLKSVGIDTKGIRKTYNEERKNINADDKARADRRKARQNRNYARGASEDGGLGTRTEWQKRYDYKETDGWWTRRGKDFMQGLGSVGRFFKGEVGVNGGTHGLTEETLFEALDKAENPGQRKAIMEEYAGIMNRNRGFFGVDKNGKRKTFGQGLHDMVFDDADVTTVDKLQEDYNDYLKRKSDVTRLSTAQGGLGTATQQREEFLTKLYNDPTLSHVVKATLGEDGKVVKLEMDENSRITAEQLNAQRLKAESESDPNGLEHQKFDYMQDQYKAYSDYDDIVKKETNAAETIANILETSASDFGTEIGNVMKEVAQQIKTALASGIINPQMLQQLSTTISTAVSADGKKGQDKKEMKSLMEKLQEILATLKSGEGSTGT